MSYTPTNWQTGDVVSAEKLNKLEQGVAGAGGGGTFLVTLVNDSGYTSDKTASELKTAMEAGLTILVYDNSQADSPVSCTFTFGVYGGYAWVNLYAQSGSSINSYYIEDNSGGTDIYWEQYNFPT